MCNLSAKLKNFSVGYNNKNILTDVNLEIYKGELTVLLGINGSGKTTLIKGICGLIKSTGTLNLNNNNTSSMSAKERASLISYIPQRCGITYSISVLDVVLMGFNPYLKLLDQPTREHRHIASETLRKLVPHIPISTDYLTLSEGQKQLILLARSMVQKSCLMLLDEPDSPLDFNNKHMMLNLISNIVKERNSGALITLHDPSLALKYCDRLIILKDRKIVSDIYVKKATYELLKSSLSILYGEIDLLPYNGEFIMVKNHGA